MSPIGRVFIVLNVILAGGFAMFAGTHLQKQHNYKSLLKQEQEARATETQKFQADITRLEQERNNFENAKTARETELDATKNQLAMANDEKKALQQRLTNLEGNVDALKGLATNADVAMKKAFEHADAAYKMALEDQKVKDAAVNAKIAAEDENSKLKATVASLEETVKGKDLEIAGLNKERSELGLLVAAAQQNGFMPGMAAPSLAGMVTNASGRLCTIQVTDNPGNVDIADQIAKRSFSFAIYDASGYKGEAVATKYEASANAVLCNLLLVKGDIRQGDKATTKTP